MMALRDGKASSGTAHDQSKHVKEAIHKLTERLKEKKGGNTPQFQNKPPPPPPQNIIINTGMPQMPNGVDTSRAPRMIGPSIPMDEK